VTGKRSSNAGLFEPFQVQTVTAESRFFKSLSAKSSDGLTGTKMDLMGAEF